MIIYQLLCSPTYVHLCKCLILVWNKERLRAEIDRGFVIMLSCTIFLRLNKPFLCNGFLDFETCLDIYISRAYKVGISITSYYWLLHDKLSGVLTVFSNLKVKPGFLKDVIITFTWCPVFADSRWRKKNNNTKAKIYPGSDNCLFDFHRREQHPGKGYSLKIRIGVYSLLDKTFLLFMGKICNFRLSYLKLELQARLDVTWNLTLLQSCPISLVWPSIY